MNHDSIQALDQKLRSITVGERKSLVDFLRHLDVFDRAMAYSALNCSSTFEYLVRKHHLPDGTAWRRVNAMRLVRTYPIIEGALEDGRLNTTQLGILSKLFTAENVEDLVRRAAHLTKTETRELGRLEVPADGLRRLPTVRPWLPVATEAPAADAPCVTPPEMGLRIPEPTAPLALVPPASPAPRPLGRSVIEPVAEDRWQWRIGLYGQRKAKLDTLRGHLGHDPERSRREAAAETRDRTATSRSSSTGCSTTRSRSTASGSGSWSRSGLASPRRPGSRRRGSARPSRSRSAARC